MILIESIENNPELNDQEKVDQLTVMYDEIALYRDRFSDQGVGVYPIALEISKAVQNLKGEDYGKLWADMQVLKGKTK